MAFTIIGDFNPDQIFCTGSFTKLLTTYVCLSLLAEKYDINKVVNEDNFLDSLCTNNQSKEFLTLFQKKMGGQFSIRDLCSYYSGLPYTFDLSEEELESVDAGSPFKHHNIPDESTFLFFCHQKITPIYKAKSKFLYSEIGILFLGYIIEKIYSVNMEDLYQKYVIKKFHLPSSQFSRKRVANVLCQDLSDKYDYPSIAILDHGYFCYSNGFYTTLNDMKLLLEKLLNESAFKCMTDIKHARAASNRLLNGMAVEIRLVNDDIIYGYEGLSFSGCNIWAYSTKHKQGYITFTNDEELAYPIIYDNWQYTAFDKVPEHTQTLYNNFITHYNFANIENKNIPAEYIGDYQRVKINEKNLTTTFEVGNNFICIRNPELITYEVVYANGHYCIKGKDGIPGASVEFYTAMHGNRYMLYDGTLYKQTLND